MWHGPGRPSRPLDYIDGEVRVHPQEGTKLYDYRKPEWQQGIRQAVTNILEYDSIYNGVFLDNCSTFGVHAIGPDGVFHPDIHAECQAALKTTLDLIRSDPR